MTTTRHTNNAQTTTNIVTNEKSFSWGPYEKSYDDFISFCVQNINYGIDYSMLGRISNSKEEYFETTKEAKDALRDLLIEFFSDPKRREHVEENHKNKYKAVYKLKQPSEHKPLLPNCISLMITTVLNRRNEKVKTYHITFSGDKRRNDEVFNDLKNFINYKNRTRSKGVEYTLVESSYWRFNAVLEAVLNALGMRHLIDENIKKGCAEKEFGKILVKLYGKKGNRVYVEGICNAYFYPYEEASIEGNKYKKDPTVKFFDSKDNKENMLLRLGKGSVTSTLPCCAHCQKYKEAYFKLLGLACLYNEEEFDLTGSPLTKSISTKNETFFKLYNEDLPKPKFSLPKRQTGKHEQTEIENQVKTIEKADKELPQLEAIEKQNEKSSQLEPDIMIQTKEKIDQQIESEIISEVEPVSQVQKQDLQQNMTENDIKENSAPKECENKKDQQDSDATITRKKRKKKKAKKLESVEQPMESQNMIVKETVKETVKEKESKCNRFALGALVVGIGLFAMGSSAVYINQQNRDHDKQNSFDMKF